MTQLFSQDSPTYTTTLKEDILNDEPTLDEEEDVFVLPASFAQQRLWFLEQWEPGVYNISLAVGMSGDLDMTAMEYAFREIIQRHESLRTTFNMVDAHLLQVISPHMPFSIAEIDLRMFPADVQTMKVRRLIKEDFQHTFDLHRGPLLRVTMLKVKDDEHALLLSMHHIISDGWSMEVLFHEFKTLYAACVNGKPAALPELPIQYADYAIWQRNWLQGEVLEEQLDYWKHQLADLPVLQLPLDHPRPAVQTFRGAVRTMTVSADLTAQLNALSRRAGVTLFMTLLGAFQSLLFRYTDQDSIPIGIPIAGRTESNLEPLIGCFINTLVLRTNFSGNPTFWEVLGRVREVALGAYDHQDIPFEKLVETIQPDRDLSYNPLTQVMFALQNVPQGETVLPGLTLIPLYNVENAVLNMMGVNHEQASKKHKAMAENKTAMFDLDMTIWERGTELFGELKYNTDLFDPETIDRLQEHFLTLLQSIVANPMQRINDLPLLSTGEKRRIVKEWNATQRPYPQEHLYHTYFAQQVERSPAAPAVSDEQERLSYRDLDERAGHIAAHLYARGIKPERLVGLYTGRNVHWAAAVLGIFKAGGVYLPLDPHHPATRLRHILQQSACQLVLTTRALAGRVRELLAGSDVEVCCLEDLLLEGPREQWEPREYAASHLAYVIYTSGSTGKPKGVMVEHRGMLNHLYAKIEALALDADDVVAQTASQCFDISVWQLLAAWLVGGQVCIYPDEVTMDAQAVWERLARDGVSVVEVVPSFLRAMLEVQTLAGESGKGIERLRWLMATGEALPGDLCQQWLERHPQIPMLNAYGPTECSDDVTHQEIRELVEGEEWERGVPIGRAIGNLQVYVLNKQQQCQPVGICGEVYVGGVGVGRGYVGDAVKTAEAFVPDPWSAARGGRLYRTGDVGRYQADGTIEYLGRVDQQVKVRGYRIELGEIEQVAREQAGVKECIVVVREDVPGSQRLVAYVVGQEEAAMAGEEVRRGMKEALPEYMVPAAVVQLPALPLTSNGKIDRQALPRPEESDEDREGGYVAPRTPVEEQLAAIWAELLVVERVGIYDDFFSIGGHSLLTVRMMTQIEKQFGKRLPLAAIFQSRTIEALAKVLRRHAETSPWSMILEAKLTEVDLQAEATLGLDICPEVWPGELGTEPANILLTGATGFLGTYLLAELLQRTSADIYCLVRAATANEGARKLQRILEEASLWQSAFVSRIKPVPGDLAQPLLGLSEQAFAALAQTVDAIYHNGALVNMVYSYQEMKATNVLGTQEIVRLAASHKIKPLHYVSTLNVFPHKGETRVQHVREQESIDEYQEYVRGGYAQSKWVAEKIVMIARSRGLPVVIYRPGRITGHSLSGAWSAEDVLCRMIKGCIQLGKSPVFAAEDVLELTPVDYVSRAIVALSQRKASLGQAFHLYSAVGAKINDVVNWINTFGYPLQQVEYDEWLEELARAAGTGAINELFPFLSLFPQPSQGRQPAGQAPMVVYDDRNTLAALARTPVACPPSDATLLHTYLSYMVRSAFLPAPAQDAA
jgi:myxalamid-type nonribosomal peptide synthetase MxaA